MLSEGNALGKCEKSNTYLLICVCICIYIYIYIYVYIYIHSKTCLKRTLKGPENFSAKGSFRLIKVHYIQYEKLNQDMHVLN